jgi:peptide-methionine (S)-S-oxide reductase
MNQGAQSETATIAGGCFWCIEAAFRETAGVQSVVSGYTGGAMPDPTYEQVCTGRTGHAEAVQVTFDTGTISYRQVLDIFFSVHDPTTLNRQGADTGTQYRSTIFYQDEQQKAIAEQVIAELDKSRTWKNTIVTQVVPLDKFYPAEQYHQEYFARHPEQGYCQMVVSPKVEKFRKQWAVRVKR